MKHLYKPFIFAILLTSAISASAQVFIGDTEYGTLNDALKAATDGDIIGIHRDININSTIDVGAKTLTIKGIDIGGVTLTKTDNKQLIKLTAATETAQASSLILENLTFKGASDQTLTNNVIICNKGTSLTMTGVTITGFTTTVTNGLLRALTDATVSLSDVTFADNTLPDGTSYDVFIPNAGIKLSMAGQCLANVYINNPESLPIAGANLDGSSKIGIYKTSPIKIGTTVIEGTSDMQIASLIGEGTEDLIIAPSIVEGQTPALKVIAKPAVLNATTGDTYTTINAANNNAPTGSRLIVYSDQTLTSFIGGNNKTLVFDAATPGVTINRKNDKLVINSGKADAEGSPTDLTLKGFTIAGDKSTVQTAYLADVRLGGNVTLSDITVKNFCNTPNGTGNINLLRCGAGTLTLDNVKFEDCTVDAGYAYVYANTGSSCSVKGDCNFSVGLAKNVNIDATGLTGTIDLMIDSPVADTQVVTGCDDPALFTLTSMPGWMLTARDGGLILAQEPLSIPDPTITGDDCKLFAPGTDLIYVPAGSTGIARFTVPEGCTLSYRFEPSATVAAEADAPDWTDYTDAGITLTESGLLHLRLTSTDGRTGERSMYVYDDPVFTGITDTATDAATVPARYYDLRGIEVSPADMRPGIYIERRGTTVRRILRR